MKGSPWCMTMRDCFKTFLKTKFKWLASPGDKFMCFLVCGETTQRAVVNRAERSKWAVISWKAVTNQCFWGLNLIRYAIYFISFWPNEKEAARIFFFSCLSRFLVCSNREVLWGFTENAKQGVNSELELLLIVVHEVGDDLAWLSDLKLYLHVGRQKSKQHLTCKLRT